MKPIIIALFAGMVTCQICTSPAAAETGKAKEKVLYSFCTQQDCTDGDIPFGGVVAIKGNLYGTTSCGGGGGGQGDEGCGTVFSLTMKTGAETVLHAFCLQQGCTDGSTPRAGLIDIKGTLYGTTANGGGAGCGDGGCGTVFSINPDTGAQTVLYSFSCLPDCTNGATPLDQLINVNDRLYGTTEFGGINTMYGSGTVFGFDLKTGVEKVLYSFCSQQNCTDGRDPNGSLIALNGTLFGSTSTGGAYNYGTVFAVNPKIGAEKVLHSFGNGKDGWIPAAGLTAVNGMLYGTTVEGGNSTGCSQGCGTVFAIDPKNGTENVLYSFCSQKNCSDGAEPMANMININGVLYGTTEAGGLSNICSNDCGTVFEFDLKTQKEKVLYSFCEEQNCIDGAGPYAGLISVKGKLYGTTASGGTYGQGTVFSLTQ